MRVLVAGMGSAIGTSVAMRLESEPTVEAISGFDLEPPRRFLPTADFHFAQPGDAARVSAIVERFRPDVVVHCWVFEPRSRSSPGQARGRTTAGTEALLGAIAKVGTVTRIVVRSGVSIYGTGRATPALSTVDTPARPTSTFGTILTRVEDRSAEVAAQTGASVVAARLASVMASNLPNPLGRLLLLPAVPVPVTSNRFGVLHLGDAARVMTAAALRPAAAGPFNVMAADPVTPLEAITIGQRPAIPMPGPVFRAARPLGDLIGTPVPEHVVELLSRGQVVEASDTDALLGVPIRRTTSMTLKDLYATGRVIDVDRGRMMPKAG